MFDGPVDPYWVENMNSLLDDNKKLCLPNSEIVILKENTSILFEVDSLEEASPATVSRCGMVYLETTKLEIESLKNSWIESLPKTYRTRDYIQTYNNLFENLLFPFIESYCSLISKFNVYYFPSKSTLVSSMLKMLECLILGDNSRIDIINIEIKKKEKMISAFSIEKGSPLKEEKEKSLSSLEKLNIINYFFMAIYWSICASQAMEIRAETIILLNEFFRRLINIPGFEFLSKTQASQKPEQDFEKFYYDISIPTWEKWSSLKSKESEDNINLLIENQSLFIETEESIKYTYIFKSLIIHKISFLTYGFTGSGKTAIIKYFKSKFLTPEKWQLIDSPLNMRTSCNQIKDSIDGLMEKRKKGEYGPPLGKTGFIYIDDFHLPARESFGTQTALEILRQYFTYEGWYDTKRNEFKKIVDCTISASMGNPNNTKPIPSMRVLRHLILFQLPELQSENLKWIFTQIISFKFKPMTNDLDQFSQLIVGYTLTLFENITKILKPLPSKPHYTFNIRDISKVIYSLFSISKEVYDQSTTKTTLLFRHWIHECNREFSDRLVNENDKNIYFQNLYSIIKSSNKKPEISIQEANNIVFGNIFEITKNEEGKLP